jgi:hypothetical protein
MTVEAASLVVLSISSDLVIVSILGRDISISESILDVEDSSDVFIASPAVLDLCGFLGMQINLV